MKSEWYECRVKYDKMDDSGEIVKVTESYVVKGASVSDAENRLIEEISPLSQGELTVKSVKEASFKELFRTDEERFYLCKVVFTGLDEDGQEKKTTRPILVQADDFKSAERNLEADMKGTISDYEIASISETKIVDLFE